MSNKSIGQRFAEADAVEAEALNFANHLLVPTNMLLKTLRKYPDITQHELAGLFAVTADVIGYRLYEEGIQL